MFIIDRCNWEIAKWAFKKLKDRFKIKRAKSITLMTEKDPERHYLYGDCDEDGNTRVNTRNSNTKAPLRWSSMLNTVAHEMVHVTHWDLPHNRLFYKLHKIYLKYLKEEIRNANL